MAYANNKGADQPVHLHSLISAFVVCCQDSIIPILAKSKTLGLKLAFVAEQVGLSLIWSQTPEDRFSHDEAHFKDAKMCDKTTLFKVKDNYLNIFGVLEFFKFSLYFLPLWSDFQKDNLQLILFYVLKLKTPKKKEHPKFIFSLHH